MAQEYMIIDGQQRLTTISLLLLALYHLIKQGIVKSNNNQLAQKIYEEYLIDKYQSMGRFFSKSAYNAS